MALSVWWTLIVSMAMCAPSRDVLRGLTLVTRVPVAPGLRPVPEVTSVCAPVPRVQWGSHIQHVTRESVHRLPMRLTSDNVTMMMMSGPGLRGDQGL